MDYETFKQEMTEDLKQRLYERDIEDVPSVDASELTNYEAMREKLSIEVISVETNAELLTKIPHESMEDMGSM